MRKDVACGDQRGRFGHSGPYTNVAQIYVAARQTFHSRWVLLIFSVPEDVRL